MVCVGLKVRYLAARPIHTIYLLTIYPLPIVNHWWVMLGQVNLPHPPECSRQIFNVHSIHCSKTKDVRFRISYFFNELDVFNLTVIGSNLQCGTDNMYVLAQRKGNGFSCSPNENSLYTECQLYNTTTVDSREYCRYNCYCANIYLCDVDVIMWLNGDEEFCEFKYSV